MAGASFHSKNIRARHAIASAVQKLTQHLESLAPQELFQRCKEIEAITRSADKVFGWSDHYPDDEGALKPELFALNPDQLAALARQEEENLRLQHAKIAQARLLNP